MRHDHTQFERADEGSVARAAALLGLVPDRRPPTFDDALIAERLAEIAAQIEAPPSTAA